MHLVKQDQSSAKNQRLNIDKERVARGRTFTPSGAKQSVNKKDITVVLKKQMSEIPSKPPRSGLREIAVSGDTRPQLNLKKNSQGTEYNKDKIKRKVNFWHILINWHQITINLYLIKY